MLSTRAAVLPVLLALACAPGAAAQAARDTTARAARSAVQGLVTVGGAAEEEMRTDQLRGRADDAGFLLRSPSSMTPHGTGAHLRVLLPQVLTTWNSRIPYSVNDGAMWAARGANAVAMAGFLAEAGPLRLIVAPEVVHAQNRAFDDLLPVEWTPAQVASYMPVWETGVHSLDLPYRPGGRGWSQVRPGQSSLTLRVRSVSLGAATENQWWGPGIRNAIVLSNQAAGVPHLFVRAQPVSTPAGRIEGRWIAGALRDSPWFDSAAAAPRGWRSLSAAALVLHPRGTTGLSVGAARAVYREADGAGAAAAHGADVLARWGAGRDTAGGRGFEQITSLFGRWVLPGDGAEVYGEWARYRLPAGLRDLVQAPEHTQGYTLGGQWVRGRLRLQGEHTYLEESPTYRTRPIGSYYASAVVRQGYTQEGQVLGAAVGPGGSGQWLAADWLLGGGRAGLFLGRTRWANDAYYANPAGPHIIYLGQLVPRSRYRGHDVSVMGGLRGALPLGPMRLEAEWTLAKRYNFLFQNYSVGFTTRDQAVDVVNHTLRLQLSPR
ncbi:MAG TPA: hypothetical protein VFH27_01485 [Longimicrobiaceae bacterium]|nr:hypothetical protein [Longimicrobiaceae bacterium]